MTEIPADTQLTLQTRDDIISEINNHPKPFEITAEEMLGAINIARGLGQVGITTLEADAESKPPVLNVWGRLVDEAEVYMEGIKKAGENQPKYLALECIRHKVFSIQSAEVNLALAHGYYELAVENKSDIFFVNATNFAQKAVVKYGSSGGIDSILSILDEPFAVGEARVHALAYLLSNPDYEEKRQENNLSSQEIVIELLEYFNGPNPGGSGVFQKFAETCLGNNAVEHKQLLEIAVKFHGQKDTILKIINDALEKQAPLLQNKDSLVTTLRDWGDLVTINKYIEYLREVHQQKQKNDQNLDQNNNIFYKQALDVLSSICSAGRNTGLIIIDTGSYSQRYEYKLSGAVNKLLAEIVEARDETAIEKLRNIVVKSNVPSAEVDYFYNACVFEHSVNSGNLDFAQDYLHYAYKAKQGRDRLITNYARLALKNNRQDLVGALLDSKLPKPIKEHINALVLQATDKDSIDTMLANEQQPVSQRLTAYVTILESGQEIVFPTEQIIGLVREFIADKNPVFSVLERLCTEAYKRDNAQVILETFSNIKNQVFQERLLLIARHNKPDLYQMLLNSMPEDKKTLFLNAVAKFGIE